MECTRMAYMNQIAHAFIGSMLTGEVVQFCRAVENLLSIAVGNQRDVDNVQNGFVGFVDYNCSSMNY
jgi:hypothetical protein